MDRAKLKAHAKRQIKGNIFILLGMYIIFGLIMALISFTPIGVQLIATLLIGGPFAYAFAKIYLGIVRGSYAPKIEDIFLGFKDDQFTRNFLAYLRYEVFILLWSLLFVIPGIIKMFSYSQMFFLLADNKKMTAGEAQEKSMELMDGHKLDLLILYLSFIPWFLLCVVTCGIALVYVAPYVNATLAEFYRGLVKEEKDEKKLLEA